MVLLCDRAMSDTSADRALFAVIAGGFSCGHALQNGKILLGLRMFGLDGQHPIVEVPRIIELVLRGADVPDPEKRIDVIRLQRKRPIVELESPLDISAFREMRIGKVPQKPDCFGGKLDGALEMEKSLIRLLQEAGPDPAGFQENRSGRP